MKKMFYLVNFVRPEPVEGRKRVRGFDKLTTNELKGSPRTSITKLLVKLPIIIALLVVIAVSCTGKGKPAELTAIDTAKVEKGTIEKTVMFTGNIDAYDAADVFPRATGKVSKKLLKEGDAVKKGQAIMLVDRDEIGYKFKPMPVDSPIDGFVGNISVDIGSNIGPSNPVAKVVRPGNIRVKLDIPERYLEVILPGTDITMTVDTLNGMTFNGKIVTSSPVVDEKTRTARVEVEVPNPENILRHGMFGRMNLVTERKDNALTVPNETISWEGDKQFVYRVVTPGGSGTRGVKAKVERRQVKVGLRNETHVEIAEGVEEGDVLAASNLIDLKDGEAVKVKD